MLKIIPADKETVLYIVAWSFTQSIVFLGKLWFDCNPMGARVKKPTFFSDHEIRIQGKDNLPKQVNEIAQRQFLQLIKNFTVNRNTGFFKSPFFSSCLSRSKFKVEDFFC